MTNQALRNLARRALPEMRSLVSRGRKLACLLLLVSVGGAAGCRTNDAPALRIVADSENKTLVFSQV